MMKQGIAICLMVLFTTGLLVSCTEDRVSLESTSVYIELQEQEKKLKIFEGMGIFEGIWTLPDGEHEVSQLVVKSDTMEFVLPEEAIVVSRFLSQSDILSVLYPDEPLFSFTTENLDYYKDLDTNADSVYQLSYSSSIQHMKYTLDGYSLDASYTSNNVQLNVYSFIVTVKGVPYRFDVSLYKGTAVFDLTTKLWTVKVPVQSYDITNLQSGWKESWSFEDDVLIFNATKRLL